MHEYWIIIQYTEIKTSIQTNPQYPAARISVTDKVGVEIPKSKPEFKLFPPGKRGRKMKVTKTLNQNQFQVPRKRYMQTFQSRAASC